MGRPVPAAAFHRFEPDGSPKILLVVGLPRPAETIAGTWAPAFEGIGPAADNREELVDVLGIPYFQVHAIALDRASEISGETHATVLPPHPIWRVRTGCTVSSTSDTRRSGPSSQESTTSGC